MTTSKRAELAKREHVAELLSPSEDLARALLEALAQRHAIRWPSTKYRRNIVGFFQDILGVDPWSRQRDFLVAVQENDRVAEKSGRRVSKSNSIAGIALWFYSGWEDALAIMSSTTARQVDAILWRELTMMRARSGRCIVCKAQDPNGPTPCPHSARIDGEIGQLARTGLKSEDYRAVIGFTAREAEAMQGIAGKNLIFLLDEASGIARPIFDAIEGNRAGGAKVVLTGNPTKPSGEFYDAFHSKKKSESNPTGYVTITISSEESPNVISGRNEIEGLATREYIEERKREWGEDSALYRIHVKGEFASSEQGQIFAPDLVREAELRWPDALEAGRLFISLDPSGPTGTGDEGMFCIRRGLKIITFSPRMGLDADGYDAVLGDLIAAHVVPREIPVVIVDSTGPIGADVYGRIRQRRNIEAFGINSSNKAMRRPQHYVRVRDELVANFEEWLRMGGAIPEDTKLEEELDVLRWEVVEDGRVRVTRKKEIRKALGRSPDRFDAMALAVWEPLSLDDDEAPFVPLTPVVRDAAGTYLSGGDLPLPDFTRGDLTRGEQMQQELAWHQAKRMAAEQAKRQLDDDDDLPSGGMDPYTSRDAWRR